MIILGIETTCDETGAAVLEQKQGRIQIVSNVVASSASLQAKYGGIIPEQAAREQIKSIIPVIEESLQASGYRQQNIDAIAVANGPGLIGSLLVGVETAKTLAMVWPASQRGEKKPLIPVNHLIGHFYANWIAHLPGVKAHLEGVPDFPCIGLLVSGGHTDLVLFKNHGRYIYLGGTRDDAAGECFDKCARLLGLPYPGGPEISKLARLAESARQAQKGRDTFNLPRPMIDSKNFDFSFSGLKTAVANIVNSGQVTGDSKNLAASIEQAIVDVLVFKTIAAAKKYKIKNIMVAGGVASNAKLRSELEKNCQLSIVNYQLHIPQPNLCTDNGAMIAAAAFFIKPTKDPLKLQADPGLALKS